MTVVVANAAQPHHVGHRDVHLDQLQHLRVAVLVDDVNPVMCGDEFVDCGAEKRD